MKKSEGLKRLPRLVVLLLNCLLFGAVIFLMNYVQNLLNSDVEINLAEVVTQNKDVITSKLMMEVNNLELVASQLADGLKREGTSGGESLKNVFRNFSHEHGDSKLFVATKKGDALFSDKRTLDISGRRYFQLAAEGIQNISDRTISRLDGEEIFVISVPVQYQGKIVGTVHKQYTPQEMYALCSVSLFSSQGYMYIINSQGYILLSSRHEDYSHESDNYFRIIFAQGNQDAARQLESDIANDRAGFMETTIGDERVFSAYTPLDKIHDWYLISSVATSAVSANANIVIKIFYVILSAIVVIFAVSMLYFLSFKNRQQANLEHIAFVDTVTHGNTFTKFAVDLRETLNEHPDKTFHLLKFDIDNFKYINNFYGFEFGDRILRRIYHGISEKLRANEFIARMSSDHFIVLLDDASDARVSELLSPLQNEDGVMISVSAGLYAITDPEESVNLIVDKASTAAQSAKGALRKTTVQHYSEKFDQQMIRNEQLKRSFTQALANDELIPFYQPKVNINTGELVGAEALARWRKSDGKLVSPGEFIPMCEQTGMIVELDMAIFEKVLIFLKKNLEEGVACVPISVNFSRLHLPDRDFLDKIMDKLRRYSVPPDLIEIELTESVMYDNHEIITQFINRMHELGLLISMDDFGSGYSSLNMLKDVPIDVLKIDKGFLEDSADCERRNIIFAAIAQMAGRLKIKVVVEGVETLENVKLMKEFGCFIAQGYYFAKPMDEPDFEKTYKAGVLC